MKQPQNLIRILHSGTLPSTECCKPTQINTLIRIEGRRIGDGDRIRSKDRQKPKTERETETERQRQRQTERQRDRETERQRERHRETETDRDRETERQRDKERQLSCLTHIDVVGSSLHLVKVIPGSGGVYESED